MIDLSIMKPFIALLPEVAPPPGGKQENIRQRIFYTFIALFIFLVCAHVPVFGTRPSNSSDPFYWMRVVLASNKGTLMELGISPMVTAGLLIEVLIGVKVLTVPKPSQDKKSDDKKSGGNEQRELESGATKVLALIIAVVEASVYVMSGMYGDVAQIGPIQGVLIVLQLTFSTLLCCLLDELLQNGWGMGSGTSLFIAVNICDTIIWKSVSLTTFNMGRGTEFEGAIIAFVHLLTTRGDKARALKEALYRPHLPNIMNLLATGLVFIVVVVLQGFEVRLSTFTKEGHNTQQPHAIKLFYTSSMPIILQTALMSNINFFSQILYRRFPSNIFINLLGVWEERDYSQNGQMFPVGGLAKYITAPNTFQDMVNDPVHALIYTIFVVGTCAMLSRTWIEISKTTARDVARRLIDEGRYLKQCKTEDEMTRQLNKLIPTAATFGGCCIGLLTLFADFLGAIGSGTGILLAVGMIQQYFEIIKKEGADLDIPFLQSQTKKIILTR